MGGFLVFLVSRAQEARTQSHIISGLFGPVKDFKAVLVLVIPASAFVVEDDSTMVVIAIGLKCVVAFTP
jgi:hypothetical protein